LYVIVSTVIVVVSNFYGDVQETFSSSRTARLVFTFFSLQTPALDVVQLPSSELDFRALNVRASEITRNLPRTSAT
jgi:hypothetical protein